MTEHEAAVRALFEACDEADELDPNWMPGSAVISTRRVRQIIGDAGVED